MVLGGTFTKYRLHSRVHGGMGWALIWASPQISALSCTATPPWCLRLYCIISSIQSQTTDWELRWEDIGTWRCMQEGAKETTITRKHTSDWIPGQTRMVCSQLLGRQRLSGFIFTPKHSHLLGVFVVHRHALSDLNSCQAINKTVWQGGRGGLIKRISCWGGWGGGRSWIIWY